MQSKIHLVKGVGSVTVHKPRLKEQMRNTRGSEETIKDALGATHTTFNQTGISGIGTSTKMDPLSPLRPSVQN